MLDKVLIFTMGLTVGGPLASYMAAHPIAFGAAPPQYITRIVRVPVAVHDKPLYQLASLSAPIPVNVPGATIEALAPEPAGPSPGLLTKPELPARDAAENKLLECVTPKMRAVWDQVEQQFGRLKIICTCDHSYYVAGTRRVSWHVSGNAIDFIAPEGKRYEVLAWLARHHTTGLTMTYADSKHVHIDVGGYVHMALASRDRALGVPGANAPARYVRARRAGHAGQYEVSDDDDSN